MNQPDEFGWFTPEDLRAVGKHIASSGEAGRFVVVGGQSLVAWALKYGIEISPAETPYLTPDLDLYGLKESARWLAEQLGAEIREATIDDNTPNAATLVMRSQDGSQKLWIDVLTDILGVESGEITRFAVTLEVEDGLTLQVLHPLLCMHSRFANLHRLRHKRDSNGISQARIAVQVARRYLQDRLENGQVREAAREAKKIAYICRTPEAVFVHGTYQIDAMDAIDPNAFPHPLFRQRVWPDLQQLVLRKRAIYWAAQNGLRHLSRATKEERYADRLGPKASATP